MKTIVALLPMLLATAQARVQPAACDLQTSEFTKDHPLVLKPVDGDESHYEVDDPDRGDSLLFESGQKVMFACPGTGFKNSKSSVLNAECVSKKQFAKDDGSNRQQSFESLKCNGLPKSVMREDGQCAGNKTALVVGFEIEQKFVQVMDICFDKETHSVVYVKHEVSHNIDGSQKNFVRPQFKEDKLFAGVAAAEAYKKEYQQRLFAEYVNSPSAVDGYVNQNQYLARGHLAPKADFVFGAQQTATFYYANAAPQWQSFNSGNWSKLEAAVRKLAVDRKHALTVYTGTHGHYTVNGKPVYMAKDSRDGKSTMPVPLVFWKVVVDKKSKAAVAIVGLNDPRGDPKRNAALDMCGPSVCDQLYWVSFNAKPKSGFIYCCTVKKLKKTVRTFPAVGEVSLLIE